MKFSPSSLQEFQRCARCFWLSRNRNIKAPRGIYPSIPGRLDKLLKVRYDYWRLRDDLPPELRAQLTSLLLYPTLEDIVRWREWNTALVATHDNLQISGMIDDALTTEDGALSALRSSEHPGRAGLGLL